MPTQIETPSFLSMIKNTDTNKYTGFVNPDGSTFDIPLLPIDSSDVTYTPPWAGAISTTQYAIDNQSLILFPNGVDDSTALANAIDYCQVNRLKLRLAAGIFKLGSIVTLDGLAVPIVGDWPGSSQSGSAQAATTIRWIGESTQVFTMSTSSWKFYGISFENYGTATDLFYSETGAQHPYFEDCYFYITNDSTRFSRSIFYSLNNCYGYGVFRRCEIVGCAPAFIEWDGNGTGNGVTPILFDDCIIESNSSGPLNVLKVKDENFDIITFKSCTVNQQSRGAAANNELCLIDTTDTPTSVTVDCLNVFDCEFDIVSDQASDRMFKLTNVRNFNFWGNQVAGGGSITALGTLVNSNLSSCFGNSAFSLGGPLFSLDEASRQSVGMNNINIGNTDGIITPTKTPVQLIYGTSVNIKGSYGTPNGHSVFELNVTDGSAFSFTFDHPGIGGDDYFCPGQVFTLMIKNTSGGVMGSITLAGGATYWKVAGGAFPEPANGKFRCITMYFNGSALVEISRMPVDADI